MLAALLVIWAGFTGTETAQRGRLVVKSVDLLVGSHETRELDLEVQLSASDAATGRVVCSASRGLVARLKPHPARPVSFQVTVPARSGGRTRDYRLHARVLSRPEGEVVENSIVITMPDGAARCSKR